MKYTPSIKTLARIQLRQFLRGQKNGRAAFIFLIVYFWVIEIVSIVMVSDKVSSIPPKVGWYVFVPLLILDFILLLIFEHDRTVMDAFLKTRPVSQIQWNRFLVVSHLWNPLNLLLPLALAPLCFWLIPFPKSLPAFLGLYLMCVLIGILVMQLKRRGKYQKEKVVSTAAVRTFKQDRVAPVFGLQVKSLLRSKRLRTSMIVLTVMCLFEHLMIGYQKTRFDNFWLFAYFYFIAVNIPQFGLGIEANFISGIWTRPLSIFRILRDKYKLSALLTGIGLLISLPICHWVGTPWYVPVSYALLCAGFGALMMLTDAYKCVRFDLFGKTFFNYQGSAGTYKVTTFVIMIVLMGLVLALPRFTPLWLSSLIFAALGVVGFAIHRPWLRRVERDFLNDKHKYLEKYLSK